jgi:hypothetical protein
LKIANPKIDITLRVVDVIELELKPMSMHWYYYTRKNSDITAQLCVCVPLDRDAENAALLAIGGDGRSQLFNYKQRRSDDVTSISALLRDNEQRRLVTLFDDDRFT